MKPIHSNWIRSVLGMQQFCEIEIEDGKWCENKATFSIQRYQGSHMVVCSDHCEEAKNLLESRFRREERKHYQRNNRTRISKNNQRILLTFITSLVAIVIAFNILNAGTILVEIGFVPVMLIFLVYGLVILICAIMIDKEVTRISKDELIKFDKRLEK